MGTYIAVSHFCHDVVPCGQLRALFEFFEISIFISDSTDCFVFPLWVVLMQHDPVGSSSNLILGNLVGCVRILVLIDVCFVCHSDVQNFFNDINGVW